MDSDGDGVLRSFIPAVYISDSEGWVGISGVSFSPSSQGGQENKEEGLFPAATGESILLLTLRFQLVGEGTATVAIESVKAGRPEPEGISLYDPSGAEYAPVTTDGATVSIAGGDCSQAATSTPRPTIAPTHTAIVPATPTPEVWATVGPTEAPAGGRNDCPIGWSVYRDSEDRFSLCYSPLLTAAASDDALNLTGPESSLVVSWGDRPYFSFEPTDEDCELVVDPLLGPEKSYAVTLPISGTMVKACFTEGRYNVLRGAVPLAADGSDRLGFIRFARTFLATSDVAATQTSSTFETLLVDYR
jgi:hypothetical protein